MAAKTKALTEQRWLWYTAKTPVSVPLSRDAYRSTVYQGELTPLPEWVCWPLFGQPHIDARIAKIDVQLAQRPKSSLEVTWTSDFHIRLLKKSWADQIADLVDGVSADFGEVQFEGKRLDDWVTLHDSLGPPLWSEDLLIVGECRRCGWILTGPRESSFFVDPKVSGRPLIVNGRGVFIDEEEVLRRGLKPPVGAFNPSRIALRPMPVGGLVVRYGETVLERWLRKLTRQPHHRP